MESVKPSAILGVDVGTSSTKGVLVSVDGRVLRSATRQHSVDRPHQGHVEMDAEIWWHEFVSLAEELTPGSEIVAVGVSGMGPCLALADHHNRPVRPAILYGVDTRATEQIERVTSLLGGADAIRRRCGSVLTSQAVGPKLAWVREKERDAWRDARRFFMPSSYLVHRLTGQYLLDQHSASQCTPLYDAVSQTWIPEWAELIAPGIELPELVWPGEVAGATSQPIGSIQAGTPVIAGTIDAWTESISVGATRPGDLMLMYGTTMFLIVTVTEPVTDPSMWGTTGAYPGTHNLAGGLATSGAITDWVRTLVGDVDFPTLLGEAAQIPAGANGLLALPYFAGERTPIQDPEARGVIAGLTLTHRRGDIYRAVLEAVGFAVRHNIETMREAGARINRVVAVGGGAQGDLWTQVVSDTTGYPQVIPTETIGASFGAAMLAATGALGIDTTSWNPAARVVTPDESVRDHYNQLYRLYRELYPATSSIVHQLVELTHNSDAKETEKP